jgi:hypothetical protein
VPPFDPGSYEHLLKLIAGNLDDKGRFETGAEDFPTAGEDLVVPNAWVILAQPRSTTTCTSTSSA